MPADNIAPARPSASHGSRCHNRRCTASSDAARAPSLAARKPPRRAMSSSCSSPSVATSRSAGMTPTNVPSAEATATLRPCIYGARCDYFLVDVRSHDWVSRFDEIAKLGGRVSCEKPLERDEADEPRSVADCDFGCTFGTSCDERGADVSRLSLEGSTRYFPDEKIGRASTAGWLVWLDDYSLVRDKEACLFTVTANRENSVGLFRTYCWITGSPANRFRLWFIRSPNPS